MTSTTILNDHLDWPGVKQVCRLERTTFHRGKTTREVAYAITSVSRVRADAARLLEWWRSHWGIENKEHYVRDEQLRPPTEQGGSRPKAVAKDSEDRCRVRIDSAPQVLAGIRNLAMMAHRKKSVTLVWTEILDFRITCSHERGGIFEF